MKRYLKDKVVADLDEKMVFLGGPRQVGKTTLALSILPGAAKETHPAYLSWDDPVARELLLQGGLPGGEELVILDEIHKYVGWRNLVKGLYDTNKSSRRFLVTGSARLDYYRRGGDSLQGRFHFHRLHPFSLHEVGAGDTGDLEHLMTYGGFPEPFLKGNARHWKRWQKERQSRVIQEDLVNLESVKEVSQLDLLASILPAKVGNPLSVNNLRQDLSVAFETADRWIQILENLYFCFRIQPFGLPKLRASKKERKLYMWDWSLCKDAGAKFENLVASNLLKYCHYTEDNTGDSMELCFIRDSVGREIDFVVVRDGKPDFAVECKTGEQKISRNIQYFSERTNIPIFYQVHMGAQDYEFAARKARVLPFTSFVTILGV